MVERECVLETENLEGAERERRLRENRERHNSHLSIIMAERAAYVAVANSAPSMRNRCTVLICDESHPIRHPCKVFDSLESRTVEQFTSMFVGLLDHSNGRRLAFVNASSGILRVGAAKPTWDLGDVFVTIVFMYLQELRAGGLLARHLHFQVDGGGTARSFSLFLLFAVLIELDWVDCVTVASLIPGHTHVDVDAFFSQFWIRTKSNGSRPPITWNQNLDLLRAVYGAGNVRILPYVYQWRVFFGLDKGVGATVKHGGLVQLFGEGKESATELIKPHRWELSRRAVDNVVVVESHKSFARESVHRAGVPMLARAPVLTSLATHDLEAPFRVAKEEVVKSLAALKEKGRLGYAGYSEGVLTAYEELSATFALPPDLPFGVAVFEVNIAPKARRARAGQDATGAKRARALRDNDDEESGAALDDNFRIDDEDGEDENDALVSDHDSGRASDYEEYDVKQFLGRRWCEELHEFEYLVRWTDPAYPDEYMAESMIDHTRTFRNYAAHLDAQDTAAAAAAELESSFQRRVRDAGDAIRRGEVSAGPEGRVCVDCKKAWTLRHTCKKTGKKYKKD